VITLNITIRSVLNWFTKLKTSVRGGKWLSLRKPDHKMELFILVQLIEPGMNQSLRGRLFQR
jgi:hypothetical protein